MSTATVPTNKSLARPATHPRRLSGFKPTGALHLGNYLGAIRPILQHHGEAEQIVMIADLHALTVEHDPRRLRRLVNEMLATLLACGVAPSSVCYVQSDVPEHAQLHYLLECATGYGEATRMVQFKQYAASGQPMRLSLLTYPVLMAADILAHDATHVVVGDDQRQHVELARDVANRFNTRYGHTFVVPRAVNPDVASRVMNLSDPTTKMGKSADYASANGEAPGLIYLLDEPDVVARKVARAVTDADGEVRHDPYRKPGVSNLLEILASVEGLAPAEVAERCTTYAELKSATVSSIVDLTDPIRRAVSSLVRDTAALTEVRERGARLVRERANATVGRAMVAIGLS